MGGYFSRITGQVVLTAQALRQHESILGADGHNQAERDQQTVQVALPHKKYSLNYSGRRGVLLAILGVLAV